MYLEGVALHLLQKLQWNMTWRVILMPLDNTHIVFLIFCLNHVEMLIESHEIVLLCVWVCVIILSLACVCAQLLSGLWLFVIPWTLDCQALLSMEFCWQGGQSGLVFSYFSIPGRLLHPGIEFASLVSPALAGRFFTPAPPGKHFGNWIHKGFILCYYLVWLS